MSDTDVKTKTYVNPERNNSVNYKPYVPQYQVAGIEPAEYRGAVVPGGVKIARPSADNPRTKRAPVRQPYAEATASPIGKGPVPNVGNSMEHTWAGVDSELVDDLSGQPIMENEEMVDNNDFVTDQALGYQNGFTADNIQKNPYQGAVQIEEADPEPSYVKPAAQRPAQTSAPDDLLSIVADLDTESYLLIVDGVPVCSGPKEEIQEQAQALVFGEHEMCDGNPIPTDDIIILKRVKVKVGLFLE